MLAYLRIINPLCVSSALDLSEASRVFMFCVVVVVVVVSLWVIWCFRPR